MNTQASPLWRRVGDAVALVLLALLFAGSWLTHGHALPGWHKWYGQLIVGVLGAYALAGWSLGVWDRRELIPAKILLAVMLGALILGWVQLLPVPVSMSINLSSHLAGHVSSLEAAGMEVPGRLPLAIAPERARAATETLLAATLVFACAVMLTTRRRAAKWLLIIVTAYGILEGLTGLGRWMVVGRGRAHGAVYNPNHWAAVVAAGCCVAFAGVITWASRSRGGVRGMLTGQSALVLLFLPVAAALVGWLAALSRGSIICLMIVSIAWIIVEWRGRQGKAKRLTSPAALLGMLAVVLVGIFALTLFLDRLVLRFTDADILTANSRVLLWQATATGFAGAPIVGLGYGGAESVINQHAGFPLESLPGWTHNDPLQWICEWGLAGGLMLIAGASIFLYTAARQRRERHRYLPFESGLMNRACLAALAVLLLHSFFDFHLRIPVVGWMALVLVALALSSGTYFGGRERSAGNLLAT